MADPRSPPMHRVALALVCSLLVAAVRPATGQCTLQWQPGDPIPTVHGDADATLVFDPDGAGPAPAVLVVGGRFGVGNQLTTSLAAFDGSTWSALGAPSLLQVTALANWNGQLVAAGPIGVQH